MNVTRRARLLNHRALRDTTILNSPFSILNLFYKNKKAPVPDFSWDRSEYALAVPPRLTQTASTLLTHQTMRAPLITGGVPVAVTWPKPFALPCCSPFTRSLPAAITPPAALLEVRSPCYSSSSLVCAGLLGMVTVYSQNSGLSSAICEKQYIISAINYYYENKDRSIVFFCTLCYNG